MKWNQFVPIWQFPSALIMCIMLLVASSYVKRHSVQGFFDEQLQPSCNFAFVHFISACPSDYAPLKKITRCIPSQHDALFPQYNAPRTHSPRGEKCSAIRRKLHGAFWLICGGSASAAEVCWGHRAPQIFVEICKTPIISGAPWKFSLTVACWGFWTRTMLLTISPRTGRTH